MERMNKLLKRLHGGKNSIKKILIIKLRGIGDVVLASAAMENISDYFPNANVDLLTEKPSAEVMKHLPFIKHIHLFNRKSIKERIKLAFKIRREKYEVVFDFFSNPSTAQITALSGAKFRAGFPYKGRKYAYNLFGPEERGKYHAARLHLEFLNRLDIPGKTDKLNVGLTDEDISFAQNFFESNDLLGKKVLGISPSGGWQSKKCEPEKFAEFASEIFDEFGFTGLIIWGPGDKRDADKIKKILGAKAAIAPDTSIRQMAALLKKCTAVIANDSGPMHIASAVGTPVLSLHGPTNPNLQGPFGDTNEFVRLDELDCIECNLLECDRNHECFLELPPEKVKKQFGILLSKNNLL